MSRSGSDRSGTDCLRPGGGWWIPKSAKCSQVALEGTSDESLQTPSANQGVMPSPSLNNSYHLLRPDPSPHVVYIASSILVANLWGRVSGYVSCFLTVRHLLNTLAIFRQFSALWVLLPENFSSQPPLQFVLSILPLCSSFGPKITKISPPRTTRSSPQTPILQEFLWRKSAPYNQKNCMLYILKVKNIYYSNSLCEHIYEYPFIYILYLVYWDSPCFQNIYLKLFSICVFWFDLLLLCVWKMCTGTSCQMYTVGSFTWENRASLCVCVCV